MNPGCRVMGLFLVVLALFQSLTVVVDAWQSGPVAGAPQRVGALGIVAAGAVGVCTLFQRMGELSVRQ